MTNSRPRKSKRRHETAERRKTLIRQW